MNIFSIFQIETEKQIFESPQIVNISVTAPTLRYIQQFKNHSATMDHISNKKVGICQLPILCMVDVGLRRDTAVAMSRVNFNYVKTHVKDENGQYRVKALEENIVTRPIQMLLVKGHPLMSRINQILMELIESGVIEHWRKSLVRPQILEEKKIKFSYEQNVLTIRNLLGGIVLWCSGIAISMLAFVYELITFEMQKRHQKKKRWAKVSRRRKP